MGFALCTLKRQTKNIQRWAAMSVPSIFYRPLETFKKTHPLQLMDAQGFLKTRHSFKRGLTLEAELHDLHLRPPAPLSLLLFPNRVAANLCEMRAAVPSLCQGPSLWTSAQAEDSQR